MSGKRKILIVGNEEVTREKLMDVLNRMKKAINPEPNEAARSAPAIGCPSAKRMATAGDDCSQLAVARPRSLSHESGGVPCSCKELGICGTCDCFWKCPDAP